MVGGVPFKLLFVDNDSRPALIFYSSFATGKLQKKE
jgi:hypothetical protein